MIKHHLASVITQSFGATENTFPSKKSLLEPPQRLPQRGKARRHRARLFGRHRLDRLRAQPRGPLSDAGQQLAVLRPARDERRRHADEPRRRRQPASRRTSSGTTASAPGGGGPSHVFKRPLFQNGVKSVVGGSRGTPDISLNAAVDGGVWIYTSFGGVSRRLPHHRRHERGIAGVLGRRRDGRPGRGHTARRHQQRALQDPVRRRTRRRHPGNNDIGPFTNRDGHTYHVPGYNARTGYDMASGLGTVDAARFVAALANGASPPQARPPVRCTGAMSFASIPGNLVVPKGATCTLTDSVVRGERPGQRIAHARRVDDRPQRPSQEGHVRPEPGLRRRAEHRQGEGAHRQVGHLIFTQRVMEGAVNSPPPPRFRAAAASDG